MFKNKLVVKIVIFVSLTGMVFMSAPIGSIMDYYNNKELKEAEIAIDKCIIDNKIFEEDTFGVILQKMLMDTNGKRNYVFKEELLKTINEKCKEEFKVDTEYKKVLLNKMDVMSKKVNDMITSGAFNKVAEQPFQLNTDLTEDEKKPGIIIK